MSNTDMELLNEKITEGYNALKTTPPDQLDKAVKTLQSLEELRGTKKKLGRRLNISGDAWLAAGASIGGIVLIAALETLGHQIPVKSFNLLPKLKI